MKAEAYRLGFDFLLDKTQKLLYNRDALHLNNARIRGNTMLKCILSPFVCADVTQTLRDTFFASLDEMRFFYFTNRGG